MTELQTRVPEHGLYLPPDQTASSETDQQILSSQCSDVFKIPGNNWVSRWNRQFPSSQVSWLLNHGLLCRWLCSNLFFQETLPWILIYSSLLISQSFLYAYCVYIDKEDVKLSNRKLMSERKKHWKRSCWVGDAVAEGTLPSMLVCQVPTADS